MSSDSVPIATLPTLSEFQQACRQTKRAAPGCDGFTGALVHTFATELAALYCPLQLKTAVALIEPVHWKGGLHRDLLLMPSLLATAGDAQFGGIPGQGTGHASVSRLAQAVATAR
eukprot:5402176-Pyramimonas_sp.AAC.1